MKSLFEELGGTFTLGSDGMYYPNLTIGDSDQRPIGKWGRMHKDYLEAEHPGLYHRLILNGTLGRHLADANERATEMLESLITQMVRQEGITEELKAEQPMIWAGRMNSIRSRAEEIVIKEIVSTL
ncbi:MAG: TnpV protein [Clostridia bacterium]|nr:TnpV protein [Clostridia bacterium]